VATGTIVVHLLGLPGSGKTSLVLATQLAVLSRRWRIGALVPEAGDELARAGVIVVPFDPGGACHLSLPLVETSLDEIGDVDVLFLEDVPDLAWPPRYDLGQGWNVTVLPADSPEAIPLSSPGAFEAADLILLTRCDETRPSAGLLSSLARVSAAPVLPISLRTERGMGAWLRWLEDRKRHAFQPRPDVRPRLAGA
jgi:hydrogenase nickel incorporation protein HypB